MKRLLFIALSAFAMNVGAHGLTIDDAHDIARAYGYVYAQNKVVKHIRERYPELLPQVMLFESKWSRRFPSADKKLAKHLKCLQLTEAKMLELMNKNQDLEGLSRSAIPKDASAAAERLEYFKYRIDHPDELDRKTFSTLNDLVFDDHPARELALDSAIYSSKGHAKAQGLDIRLKLPASWKQSEATRPHIVQKWMKYDEGNFVSVSCSSRKHRNFRNSGRRKS